MLSRTSRGQKPAGPPLSRHPFRSLRAADRSARSSLLEIAQERSDRPTGGAKRSGGVARRRGPAEFSVVGWSWRDCRLRRATGGSTTSTDDGELRGEAAAATGPRRERSAAPLRSAAKS